MEKQPRSAQPHVTLLFFESCPTNPDCMSNHVICLKLRDTGHKWPEGKKIAAKAGNPEKD